MNPSTLHEFLLKNQEEVLALTERKTLELAGTRPSSDQLKQGLPIFFNQLLGILRLGRPAISKPAANKRGATKGANDADEPAMAKAAGQPEEAELAKSAGLHGIELLRLGYTLSHVVHAYGAMCQSITEHATKKKFPVTTSEFHDLNQCLDVAIAGAVTEYQTLRDTREISREVEKLGSLAHEIRNAVTSATIAFQLIGKGTVGAGGNTGEVVKKSLKRIEELVDGSLTEVRLHLDPEVHVGSGYLLQVVDQILITAEIEAQSRNQKIEIKIDPALVFEADQQAFHSALSNVIQNALKYTYKGGTIQVRGNIVGERIVVEVEDECGGLLTDTAADLFEPYVQKNENRKGVGLGLSIAQRAIVLNHGTIEALNLPGKGCIFRIVLPKNAGQKDLRAKPAA